MQIMNCDVIVLMPFMSYYGLVYYEDCRLSIGSVTHVIVNQSY